MSLRRITRVLGAGIFPATASGNNGVDDVGGDPSKPTTLAIVISNSIWFYRTARGRILFAIACGRRLLQKSAAMIMHGIGFACSASVELLLTSQNDFKNQWLPLVESLRLFLQTSGIADELVRGFSNYRFLSNVAILARIQNSIAFKNGATGEVPRLDRRKLALMEDKSSNEKIPQEKRRMIIQEGKRFMKYTTAAYGISMIDAAEIDVHGAIQTSKSAPSSSAIDTGTKLLVALKSSLQNSKRKLQLDSDSNFDDRDLLLGRISEHIGVPENDIDVMNLWDDQSHALRFFIATDHVNKCIVLSIRGSFTVKEILIDIAAFSRPFCGGQAHSEMANAAEKIWEEAKDVVGKLLSENSDYELILTGHSLGAGAATLLNILLHENGREKVNGRAVRCFAYASPPVFAGEVDKQALLSCISYIHDADVVPFLSIDSVRRVFAALHAIEESNLSVWIRTLILWGSTEVVNLPTQKRIESALHDSLPEKEGAPELLIPAHMNVWMRSVSNDLSRDLGIQDLAQFNHFLPSDFVLADSRKLARMGVSLDPLMVTSHFPNGYESALHSLR